MTSGRIVAGVLGGLGSLVLAGGVAAAVTQAHVDPLAILPAVCRDNPGSTGGKLPGGKKLDTALRQIAANPNRTTQVLVNAAPALGSGSAGDLSLRAQALAGSGGGAGGEGGGLAAGTGSVSGQGTGPGIGNGNGGGAGGTGGQSGNGTGPAGGQGKSPIIGNGPDATGVPQPPNPKLVPPPVPPPVTPKASRHAAGRVVGTLLILLLIGALLFGAYLLLRGRSKPEGKLPDGTGMQPAQADALAQTALSQGDLDAALRWTFVSGLLRLDTVGVLPYHAARTTRECSRWVRSAHFPVLADGFDLVAYGGRHATMPDVIEARHGWNALLEDVVRWQDIAAGSAQHGPLVKR